VTWDALCRSTIHYPDDTTPPYHIQSLWDFPRPAMVGGVVVDHTCVSCHTPIGAAATVQIPAGNLDLRALIAGATATAWQQLLFPRPQLAIMMGLPVPTGVMLPPPIAAGSSANSAAFLSLFDGTVKGAPVDHTNFLSMAELRLISEWIDIGAQYYNDPFVAPAN
jgi:hypothetical protein